MHAATVSRSLFLGFVQFEAFNRRMAPLPVRFLLPPDWGSLCSEKDMKLLCSAHAQKKGASKKMIGYYPIHQLLCAGWDRRNVISFFDYVIPKLPSPGKHLLEHQESRKKRHRAEI